MIWGALVIEELANFEDLENFEDPTNWILAIETWYVQLHVRFGVVRCG